MNDPAVFGTNEDRCFPLILSNTFAYKLNKISKTIT